MADLLHARVMLVLKYDAPLMIDRALSAHNYFAEQLVGCCINETPRHQLDWVQDRVAPYLKRHGVAVLGTLRNDPLLAAPSVAELSEGLGAENLCCPESMNELVENMLVGAMSVESALSYFRRQPNKVVVTGGDRRRYPAGGPGDLDALFGPDRQPLSQPGRAEPRRGIARADPADQQGHVQHDQDCRKLLGRSRFQQAQKVQRFTSLLEEHFDFSALYTALNLKKA